MTAAQTSLGGIFQTPKGSVEVTGVADREIRVTIADIRVLALLDPNERCWVVVKPVCEQLGINFASQTRVLSNREEYDGSTVAQRQQLGRDGRRRNMLCVELETCVLWLARIRPSSCKESARPGLRAVSREVVQAIREKIHGKPAQSALVAPMSPMAMIAEIAMATDRTQKEQAAQAIAIANIQRDVAEFKRSPALLSATDQYYAIVQWHQLRSRRCPPPSATKAMGKRASVYCRDNGVSLGDKVKGGAYLVNTYALDVLDHLFGDKQLSSEAIQSEAELGFFSSDDETPSEPSH